MDGRRTMSRSRLGFSGCVVVLLVACASAPDDKASSIQPPSVRADLPGRWDWVQASPRCGDTGGEYSFSADGRQLLVHVPAGVWFGTEPAGQHVTYEVLDELQGTLRVRAIGEPRKTDSGDTVVWDLVMLKRDAFCWHRTDWKAGECTERLTRCEAGDSGSVGGAA